MSRLSPFAAKVLLYLKEHPGNNALDISRALDANHEYVVSVLAGLERKGKARGYYPGGQCEHCDGTGIIQHGYMQGHECACVSKQ